MDADEIRAELESGRRACADAISHRDADPMVVELAATLSRLMQVIESMLAERESYADRLRRSSTRTIAPPPPLSAPPTHLARPSPEELGPNPDVRP